MKNPFTKDAAERGHHVRIVENKPITANPYPGNTEEHADWRHAWIFAFIPSGRPRGVQRYIVRPPALYQQFQDLINRLIVRNNR